MLSKLLKYDLKSMYKYLSIFYILCLFFSLTTKILFSIKQTAIITILSNISLGCLIAMIANIFINTLMRNWVTFKRSLYNDESYLTHTLPVTKKTLYNSKFILSLITLFTSFIVVILSLLISFYTKDNINLVKELIINSFGAVNMNYIMIILILILILFLEIYSGLQSGFLGIIVGNRKSNNKILFSIIFGFCIYIITQIIVLIGFFIVGIFNKDVMSVFTSNNISFDVIKIIVVVSIIMYLICIFVIKILASKILSRGVNVD